MGLLKRLRSEGRARNLEALNELSELYLLSGKQAKAIQTQKNPWN